MQRYLWLGFITPEGIKAMRSILTNSIFQDELYSLYQQPGYTLYTRYPQ